MKTTLGILFLLPLSTLFGEIAVTLPAKDAASTNSGDVYSSGSWGSSLSGGFQISWNITQTGSTYSYIYTLSNASGGGLSKGVDSFILELNPNITSSNLSKVITDSNTSISGSPKIYTSKDGYLPGSVYGIEFNVNSSSTATISFTSTNAPVWGSFYADNGSKGLFSRGYAYNTAFGSDPTASTKDFGNWIPSVGGSTAVLAPEPSTMLILGTTLVAAVYFHKRRKSTQT